MVPAMARVLDHSPRRVYKNLTGQKPTRKVVSVSNPYRFQSRLVKAFQKCLVDFSKKFVTTLG